MPGVTEPVGTAAPGVTAPGGERVISDEDKKLAADWRKKITAARDLLKDNFTEFEKNRRLLAGKVRGEKLTKETVRANLHFANMAQQIPQIYAKDPEFSCQPTKAVSPEQLTAAKAFARTAEFVITKELVKGGRLKAQAKKLIRSTFTTSVGWVKASWQEKLGQDPLIQNKLKDTQDNISRIQMLMQKAEDPQAASDQELTMAQLKQTIEGLSSQAEVVVSKGIALDFVMSEDIVILDSSIRTITDYTRAAAIDHRVWMTPEQFQTTFGYAPSKAKMYSEQAGSMSASTKDRAVSLVCVDEVWDQDSNRVLTLCDGEDGFCREPYTPDWTGERWYPFFLVAFNEIDGSFYPLSDIELAAKLVEEYNKTREDFVRDRKACLPVNVVREGGSLTDDDLKKIKNREGSDIITVKGIPGQALSADIFIGQLGKLDSASYDTTASRYDMERLVGGSDSSTGSITKAKTLGEAEILQRGLQSRNAERRDTMEDMFNELGPYCLEILLRKLTEQEVKAMAGPAATWPRMSIDQIFDMVTLEVRGGSTGKPDQMAEQDRWTKLLPIINESVQKISELRAQGQEELAQAVIEITRETLRRFDERIDIEQFLPKAPEQGNPQALQQENNAMKQQMKHVMDELQKYKDAVDKGMISAAATVATSKNPATAAIAFQVVLNQLDPGIIPTPEPTEPQEPAGMAESSEMQEHIEPPMGAPEEFESPLQTATEPLNT